MIVVMSSPMEIVNSEGVVLDEPFWFSDDQELGSEAYAVVSILGSQVSQGWQGIYKGWS